MYNYEYNEWNDRSRVDWSVESNNYPLMSRGNSLVSYDNYPCGDKSVYLRENYPVTNYGQIYPSCVHDDCVINCGNCSSQFAYSSPSSSCSLSANSYYRNNCSSHQRNAFWSKTNAMQTTGQSNYPPNSAGTSSGVVVTGSDPLNALQNLTVSAGQSAQLMAAQQGIRLNSSTAYSQIRQRPLGQGSINRPMDAFSTSQSPLSQQLAQPQIPANVVMGNPNAVNSNNIRMGNSMISMKPEMCVNQNSGQQSLMLPPYPMESCNTIMNTNQMVVKGPTGKLAQYNIQPSSQYQTSKDQFMISSQPSVVVPSLNNQFQTSNSVRPTSTSVSNFRPQNIISDEEAKKVKEEVKRLRERFFKILTVILENPKNCAEDEIKVWTALRNLLDNPDSIAKPLLMRHIQKIEQHLLKAEQHLISKNSSLSSNIQITKQHTSQQQPSTQIPLASSNRTTIQKPATVFNEATINKPTFPTSNNSTDVLDISNDSSNSSSLDIAFDDVCHQLNSSDKSVVKKVQKNLVEFVKSRQLQYQHFLPKRVFVDLENEMPEMECKSKRVKVESVSIEEEICLLDNSEYKGINEYVKKDIWSVIDESILGQLDLNFGHVNMDFVNLIEELKLLECEFQISTLETQQVSKDWFSYDSDWSDSQFYSFLYKNKNLPSVVPPIKVRISADYEDSGYTDWNLNLDSYPPPSDDFLDDVANTLSTNFTEAHHHYQWSGIPLLYVISLYKRSIDVAYSNHLDQASIEH